eukprot:2147934-Karenia_brevis.AAC.1
MSRVAGALWECAYYRIGCGIHHIKSHTGNPLSKSSASACTFYSRGMRSVTRCEIGFSFGQISSALQWMFLSALPHNI